MDRQGNNAISQSCAIHADRSQAQGMTFFGKITHCWLHSSFHRYVKQGAYDSNWGAGAENKC